MKPYRSASMFAVACSFGLFACSSRVESSGSGAPVTGVQPGDTGTKTGTNSYDELYAKCTIESGFAGDELCVVAPDPSEGLQLHYGPTDYSDADQMAKFIIEPGGEIDDQIDVESSNDEDVVFSEYHSRLRGGTHHMILWASDGPGKAVPGLGRFLLGQQSALGVEGGRLDIPKLDGKSAPENEGLAEPLSAHSGIGFNMHYVNTGDEPLLREGWVNIHYADKSQVKGIMDPITFYGGLGMAVPARTNQVVTASCEYGGTGEPLRVLGLTGHMHAHGVRFSAYKVAAGSQEKDLVYETYDWAEADQLNYDSVHENVMPDAAAKKGGGMTGALVINPGDRIDYECEFHNDSDNVLRFANEAYTAEMCNLFGFYTPSVGGPWSCWNQ